MSVTGKCAPLHRWFRDQPPEKTAPDLSFSQIKKILRDKLPPSAFRHEPWWRDASASTRHVQALAWLEAGWRVRTVDVKSGRVTFEREYREVK